MKLTVKNYHSPDASKEYFGSTQYKAFAKCPAKAMALLNGEWVEDKTAYTMGQFLDAYFEGRTEEFIEEHPEMVDSRKGTLKVAYGRDFDKVIAVIKNDPIMMRLMTGKQQMIFTGEIAGVPFKVMIDSLHDNVAVDRKFMASFRHKWSGGEQVAWWQEFRYDIQAAIYSEILRQNGIDVPFELVAISKEDITDKAWVRFTEETLDNALSEVAANIREFDAMKQGLLDAHGCGYCDYCTSKKMLTEPMEV